MTTFNKNESLKNILIPKYFIFNGLNIATRPGTYSLKILNKEWKPTGASWCVYYYNGYFYSCNEETNNCYRILKSMNKCNRTIVECDKIKNICFIRKKHVDFKEILKLEETKI